MTSLRPLLLRDENRAYHRSSQYSRYHPEHRQGRHLEIMCDDHLQSNQDQNQRQPGVKKPENFHQPGNSKEQRPQSHDSEHIRGVDDESIER